MRGRFAETPTPAYPDEVKALRQSGAGQGTLLTRGLRLEYATLTWNVVGTGILIVTAVGTGSVVLAGFGLDSLIEVFASLVVVWQLTDARRDQERRALSLIGWAFFLLAAYVLIQSSYSLIAGVHAGRSALGTLWVGLTVLVMLGLAAGKHRVGRQLANRVLQIEARVTLIDAYLAGAVLVGLLAGAVLGWWWADPVAALVIVYYGVREGVAARMEATRLAR